jgi:hypothetical protein
MRRRCVVLFAEAKLQVIVALLSANNRNGTTENRDSYLINRRSIHNDAARTVAGFGFAKSRLATFEAGR